MRILSINIVLLLIVRLCAAQTPSHLTTDLLEHTGRVFLDGYPANVSLAELGNTIERYQLVEIHSAQPMLGWVMNSNRPNTLQTAYRILLASSPETLVRDEADMWDSGRTESDNSTAVRYNGKALQPATIYYWKIKTWDNHGAESRFSQVKSFITAKALDGATALYPSQVSDEFPVTIKPLGKGHSFIDFGKASFGRLKLTLTSGNETDTVTVRLGECAKDGQVDRNPGASIRYAEYKLPLMAGTHTYALKIRPDKRNTGPGSIKMPEYTGEVLPFRYCEIENYATTLNSTNIVRQTVHYPFNETASAFHSSDSVLNQVWELCKYSVKATSFSIPYPDGDRERVPYEADQLISQLCHYSADKEYAIGRYSHEYLIDHPTWPTEWLMQSILMAWNDYMYTGNTVSLQKYYDALKNKTLIALKENNGLISTRTGKKTAGSMSDIVDWPHSTPALHVPCVHITNPIDLPTAKFKTGDEVTWKNSDFNDSDWSEIRTTKQWESQGYDGYDGYAWYRIHFVLPEKPVLKDSVLINLGQIDDAEETYLNGVCVGKTGSFPSDEGGFFSRYNIPRTYKISANDPAIRWGKENVLAVRVYDDSKGGGIMGLGVNKWGETDGYVFTDYNTVVNAYHYHALRLMSVLAGALGKTQEQAQLSKDAQQVKNQMNKLLLNPKTGLYRDGIGTDHSSLHANMYPLAFGMVPEKNKQKVIDFIHSRGLACSVYGAQALVDAIYNANDAAYGLKILSSTDERSWYNMIRAGSTISLEAWDNKYKSDQDWNHIWGAAAGNLITRKLMGIEPIEPGFGKIRIKPQPATLKHAAIKAPSIRGDIYVSFDNQPGERFTLEVEIPANSASEVWLPKLSAKYRLTVDNITQRGTVDGEFVKVEIGSGKHSLVILTD